MTTTFLNISNMQTNRSIDTVETLLNDAGYRPALIFPGKAKINGRSLSYKDIVLIKKFLMKKGFNLLSISETTNSRN